MSLEPLTIALIGFGEAGTAIARGLAENWRGAARPGDNRPRRLIAIDTALDLDTRGRKLGEEARRLDVAIERAYTAALSDADLIISAVPGEFALDVARSAAPLLKAGAFYLDLCTVTGAMAETDRAVVEGAGARYVDVAVMGSFFGRGQKAPMLLAGPNAPIAADWMNANGFDVTVLGPKPGSASAVKVLRSVLIKGVEALAIESFVAARRQGLLDEVMGCLGDVDHEGFGQFLARMVETHLVHAGRRSDEMVLVAQMLRETGVPPLMSETTYKALHRTVDAGAVPTDGKVRPLDETLAVLTDKVFG
ncbi:MAG: NAD(P)-dependent oxidoreductase [Alphaproteobacteria bacterium]|nr:NAD(P)-dependent oxidoreductase [Alphaproteobacteria bacterium]